MPLLSVVVPLHGVEPHLEACLESLRRQTLTDLEVITVVASADAIGAGVERADGEFLAFAGAGDLVHPHAFELMAGSLAESGSDLACCRVMGFDDLEITASRPHALAITKTRRGTHLSRLPELVGDRTLWNKVFRRLFWEEGDLTFNSMLYEDYPVSVAAHLSAGSVDVLADGLYYRRKGEARPGTITELCRSAHAVLDQVERDAPAALPTLHGQLLEIDLPAIRSALATDTDPGARALVQSLAVRLDPGQRQHARHPARRAPARRSLLQRSRRSELLPGLGGRAARRSAAQAGPVRPGPRAGVEYAVWHDDALDLTLRLDPAATAGEIDLWLEGPDGRIVPLPAHQEHSRWRTQIPLAALAMESPVHGFWALRMRVGAWTVAVENEPAGWLVPSRALPGHADLLVQPHAHEERGFGLLVQLPQVLVEAVEVQADGLVIAGRMRLKLLAAEPRLLVSPAVGAPVSLRVDLARGPGRWRHFTAEIPVSAQDGERPQSPGFQSAIAVRLTVGTETRPLVLDPAFRAVTFVRGARSLSAVPNAVGELELVAAGAAPQILDASWVGRRRLRIAGAWRGEGRLPDEVVLVRAGAERREVQVPLVHDGRRFQFKVDVRELLAPYDGPEAPSWHPVFGFADGPLTPTVTRDAAAKRGEPRTIGGQRVALSRGPGDLLRILVERL